MNFKINHLLIVLLIEWIPLVKKIMTNKMNKWMAKWLNELISE